jgi:transcriptional regulator with XRE-family HTH domain
MAVTDVHSDVGSFGGLLRYWRTNKGLTQLDLANRAASTTRYISFLETGRSRPGENMVLRLADALKVPVRERNDLLVAAGYQGRYSEATLNSVSMEPFKRAIHYSVNNHDPYPSFAINRWYDVVEKNQAADAMFGNGEHKPDLNLINAIFEETDTKERMENWLAVASAIAARLRREAAAAPNDQRLQELLGRAYASLKDSPDISLLPDDDILICPTFRVGNQRIRTISMIARFGNTRDILLDEIRVETIFPYDKEAENFFHSLAAGQIKTHPCWEEAYGC